MRYRDQNETTAKTWILRNWVDGRPRTWSAFHFSHDSPRWVNGALLPIMMRNEDSLSTASLISREQSLRVPFESSRKPRSATK